MNNLPDPLAALGRSGLDRRKFLGLAGLGAGALALAACGGPETAPSTPADGSGSAGPSAGTDFSAVKPAAEIQFWSNHPGSSKDVETEIVNAFNATGAGITVKLVDAGANYEEAAQKFQAAQASGQLPDVIVLSDVWWFRYYMLRTIIPVDAVAKVAGIDATKYRQGLWNDYQYKGQQWAVPYARSTPIFYYNKEHWKKAGLEDRAPKTWAEFKEWAPKISQASGLKTVMQLPALAGYAGWSFQNNLWGEGGGWSAKDTFEITTDSDATVAGLQFLQDSVKDGWAKVASKEATDDFAAVAASATIGSTGSLVGVQKTAQFDIGVGFLPGGSKATDMVCPTGGAGLGIPSGISPERQLAAAKFIAFATSAENSVKFSAATGYLPAREDADVATLVKANPLAQIAIDQLAHTRPQDFARVFIPGADQEMAVACAAILNESKPVKETMTALKTKLQGMFDNDVKDNI